MPAVSDIGSGRRTGLLGGRGQPGRIVLAAWSVAVARLV